MNIKRLSSVVAAAGIIAAVMVNVGGLAGTAEAAPAGLPGTWLINIAPSAGGGPAFQALWTINADGTMTETSDGLGKLEEGPAHGVWARQGKDYALTFELFTFDEKGLSNGRVRVRNLITLDKPDHFKTINAVDLIDLTGKVTLNIDTSTSEGIRLQLGPLPSAKVAPPVSAATPTDPIAIVQAYYAAIKAKDFEKAISFYSDDIVSTTPSAKVKGKAAAQELLKSQMDQGYYAENSNYRVSNGEVRYAYKVFIGGKQVDENTDGLTIVKDGKIVFDGLEKDKP